MEILFIVLCIFLVVLYFKFFRPFAVPSFCVVSGGVKTGKSALSLVLAIRTYRITVFKWRIARIIFPFRKAPRPLFYSNVPLAKIKYTLLTNDIILRKVRIIPKSICFVDESALMADSQLIRNPKLNSDLLLFFKLFSHYSHGGKMFMNSQSLDDLHYSIKRCISNYVYIVRSRKLPFITLVSYRELTTCEDLQSIAVTDANLSNRFMIYFNGVYRKYDCYCYSVFTDGRPLYKKIVYNRKRVPKPKSIISFRPEFKTLGDTHDEEKN